MYEKKECRKKSMQEILLEKLEREKILSRSEFITLLGSRDKAAQSFGIGDNACIDGLFDAHGQDGFIVHGCF